MKSDRQILDSEYNEILLQTVAVIEKSRSMLAVQVSTIASNSYFGIGQILYLTAYLERWGTGIERIVQRCREYDVPELEWSASEHDVTVTFWRNGKDKQMKDEAFSGENGENSDENQLSERQTLIYSVLKANGENTAKSLARMLNMSQRTVEREGITVS